MSFLLEDPKTSILRRFDQLQTDWRQSAEIIEEQTKRQNTLRALYEDLKAAARVFQFDLDASYMQYVSEYRAHSSSTARQPIAAPSRTIKQMIVEMAADAYPKRIRASELRSALVEQGLFVHDKTVGMTLYRLAQAGIVRRIGRADWCFVPESERLVEIREASLEGDPGLYFEDTEG